MLPAGFELLDAHSRPSDAVRTAQKDAQRDEPLPRAVRCARCGAQLTDAAERIAVAGQHEHTFFNPAGVVFHVACFGRVPGCLGVGPFSAEFSWFPGERWQIGVCASCGEHLGWHFAGETHFSCLITRCIREDDA